MKGNGCDLLGRYWFDALRIRITGIHQLQQAPALDTVLRSHGAVFDEHTDGHKGAPVSIELKADATPCFFNSRPVPFALRSAVEQELEKLTAQGILEPTQHADWATPVVEKKKRERETTAFDSVVTTVAPSILGPKRHLIHCL